MTTHNKQFSWVLMGDESLLIQCASVLLERGHSLEAVVTASEAVAGWAKEQKLVVKEPGRDLERDLADVQYDWFFSIANLRMVPQPVWRKARKGSANFHDGPLPAYAGLNTPAWAILNGEPQHGVTWHELSEKVDEGDIYSTKLVDISENETSLTLNTKCFEAGIESFLEILETIESDSISTTPQDLSSRTYFSKQARPELAATIDFTSKTAEIDRLSRALTFGAGYKNPLCLPKIRARGRAYNVALMETSGEENRSQPATVISVDDKGAVIAAADGSVLIKQLSDETGAGIAVHNILKQDDVIAPLTPQEAQELEKLLADVIPNEAYFRQKLKSFKDIELHGLKPVTIDNREAKGVEPRREVLPLSLPRGLSGDPAIAALTAYLARVTSAHRFDLAFVDDRLHATTQAFPGYFAASVPLTVSLDDETSVDALIAAISDELSQLRRRHTYPGDLISRTPDISHAQASIAIRLTDDLGSASAVKGCALTFVVPSSGDAAKIIFDHLRIPRAQIEAIARHLAIVLPAFAGDGKQLVSNLPLMSAETQKALVHDRNETRRDYDQGALVHKLFEVQVDKTPEATAVVCEGETLSYSELDERANILAHKLIKMGVKPDTPVGLHLRRSCDLIVGALAILKAGGAYVPLDPAYPAERLAMMIEDGGLETVLTQSSLEKQISPPSVQTITIDTIAKQDGSVERPVTDVTADNLAYVIFTSGSTGRPKGVMVEHRNVANFFAGMDERISRTTDTQPVWLAVTSLSFDISVLELFWTLSRGFKVIIHTDDKREAATAGFKPRVATAPGAMNFSLFHWGNDDGPGPRKYRLLLDSAKYADTHGFRAVWTPERHFHAFGGPYPNPAVTGAAVAAVTNNLDIRAGSCVLPLHHPARVAEEWAVIDNISNGRVGLAVASGWMPEDFLLRPENAPPNNKSSMLRDMEVLRRLWRGEKVSFEAPGGKRVDVTTLPRPVSSELPLWVTTAGNPETYREAARNGANVLTHLLGQSIEEVGEKIKIYRETLKECGKDPEKYTVTLMLHTLLGEDREQVREIAREPMISYLRSAAGLIKQYAWAFPAFKKPKGVSQPFDIDLGDLEEEELDAILEFAFLRYFDDSGLFGTIEDATARTRQLIEIGVNEIACLIDFGVPTETVMRSLEPLAKVVAAYNPLPAPVVDNENYSFADLIARHGVTHLQCTPSMATLLLMNDEDAKALRHIAHLFIGGEALKGSLLEELRKATDASIENMYGPTETTIWSSTGPAVDTDASVPIGTPIANTQFYILDDKMRPVPSGLPGELFIGGDGVARGYFKQDKLTARCFLPNPFIEGGRIYRTGDVVSLGSDGALRYLGRVDHQVKVRGYRIEMGEIEACIGRHPKVAEAVVIVRKDNPDDERIVAYIRFKDGDGPVSDEDLRAHIKKTLPEFMVPSHFAIMDAFPLTPNAKVDRKALPRPDEIVPLEPALPYVAPDSDVEKKIADSFKRVLGVERVGSNDNFFTLGGHSLLAVQMHRDLKSKLNAALSITDIYRFPTVAGLANHLRDGAQASKKLDKVASRAAARRKAMAGRRAAGSRARERS